MRRSLSASQRGFTAGDRRRLEERMRAVRRDDDVRLYRRLQAVCLVAQGHSPSKAAQLTGFTPATVYNLVRRYLQTHSLTALEDHSRSGRPSLQGHISDEAIRHILTQSPAQCGYATNVWTAPLLAQHLKTETGHRLSARTVRRRLHAMGLRWKRPRYIYAEKAPHIAQKKGPLYVACNVCQPMLCS